MLSPYLLDLQKRKLGIAPPKEEKKQKPVSRMSDKRKFDNEDKKLGDAWFKARHKEMTGKCLICNEPTCTGVEFKCSVCHLFPKAIFKSIKWHLENWIELCFYGKSHHTNFDNSIITFEDLKLTKAWPGIVRKFKILYPLMTAQEQGRIPQILKNELK